MRLISLIVFSIIININVFTQKVLTLKEAVNISLQRNSNLKKMVNSLSTYESSLKTAYGEFIPTLSASGSWSWNRTEDKGGTVIISGIPFSTPAASKDSRNYSVGISGNWTLFDGLSNFANLSRNQNNLDAAKFDLSKLKQDIVFQTVSSYYDLMNAKKLYKVKEDNLKWNQKNLEIITERNKLGSVTLADVLAQQVKVGNAELELIQSKNTIETLKSNLLFQLGLDVLENYDFEEPAFLSKDKNIDVEKLKMDSDITALVTQAISNRSDYKSYQLALQSSNENIKIAKAGHLPSLSNNFGLSSRSETMGDLFSSKTYYVGLSLNIPIFSGWNVENRVQLAEVDYKTKEIQLSDLERTIKQNIQKTFLDLQAAEKRMDVSQKNVSASEENRKIEEEKYSLGSSTLLNVLIANSEYTNALTNFINSQFDYLKLKEQLQYYLGVLDYKKYE